MATAVLCHDLLLVCSHLPRGDNDRDVFNEKPSKEEQMAATQVRGWACTEIFVWCTLVACGK